MNCGCQRPSYADHRAALHHTTLGTCPNKERKANGISFTLMVEGGSVRYS